jgi:UDP-2,3-diacylglucosamine hydrolase
MQKLSEKNICHDFKDFETKVEMILENYETSDLVIEGHFHQSQKVGKYISLPSLACQGKVARVQEGEIVFITL